MKGRSLFTTMVTIALIAVALTVPARIVRACPRLFRGSVIHEMGCRDRPPLLRWQPLMQCSGAPYQGKDTGDLYYRSAPLILPHAEGGILEMDWHAWLYPTDRLIDVPLSIVSHPTGPTLFASGYKSPVQADLAELSHETDRWGFTPLIQRITVRVPKGTSILQLKGSDRSVFANIKFTSER